MKKGKLLLVVAALMFAAVGCNQDNTTTTAPTTTPEVTTPVVTTPTVVEKNISVTPAAGVEVSAPSKAEVGTKVSVTVTNSDETQYIEAVKANDVVMAKEGENNYYFLMPETDVVITVTTVKFIESRSITVLPVDDVTVDVVSSAKIGSRVDFDIQYDAEKINIESVTANGVSAAKIDNDSYYFVMPAFDVEIEITTSPIHTYYKINNLSSDTVSFVGLPSEAKAGDVLTFNVALTPGYAFTNKISASTGSEEAGNFAEVQVDVTDNGYQVVMPEGELNISAETIRSVSMVAIEKIDGSYDANVDGIYYKDIDSEEEVSVNKGDYVPFGATVRVKLKDNLRSTGTGIELIETGETIVGEEDESGDVNVTFTMPYINLTVRSTVELIYRPITLINSKTLTLSLYSKVEDAYTPITEAVSGDTVYVKVDGTTEDITVKSISGSYMGGWSGTTVSNIELTLEEDGYYSFKMPTGSYEYTDVKITVEEKNDNLLAGEPFLGTYVGFNMYGSKKSNTKVNFSSSYILTINKDGSMKKGSSSFTCTGATGNVLNFKNSSGTELHAEFSDKLLVGQYSFNSWPSNDMGYYVKLIGEDTTDDMSKYKISWVSFGGSGNRFFVAEVYYEDVLYTRSFFDTHSDYYDYYLQDVSFEFTSGTTITDSDATYAVKVGGVTIGNVTNKTTFEYVQVADEIAGTYTGEKGDIVLDGFGAATIGEDTWNYTFEESTVTLVNPSTGTTLVITLDGATYTVVSEVTPENLVAGKKYEGMVEYEDWDYDYNDWATYYYYLSFDFISATQVNVCIRFYSATGTQAYPFSSHPNGGTDAYTINSDGTITVTMYDGSTAKLINITVNEDATEITVVNDFNNGYPTGGTVCSLVVA